MILKDLESVLSAYDKYLTSTPSSEPQRPSAWIFQANPKVYDLKAAVSALKNLHFTVRQHADQVRVGDTVYLWESGDSAGTSAVAQVTEGPGILAETPEESGFWRTPPAADDKPLRVRLTIQRVLDHKILRADLVQHPILSRMLILRMPQGTNFSLTEEEATAMQTLLKQDASFTLDTATEGMIEAIGATGFVFEPWQVAAYVTAVRTKPFVILAGVSGTGKSKLPELVARQTGGQASLLPVRPDWTDSSKVLGYLKLDHSFNPGPLLELADMAAKNPERHYVCIVDEMNLARVEHYFAEILSRIEDRHRQGDGGYRSGPLWAGQSLAGSGGEAWATQGLPPNLAIVGTVNMDESAHGFSRKVLDRAFTLELSDVDLGQWQEAVTAKATISPWPPSAWFPRAARLGELHGLADEERQLIQKVIKDLTTVNKFLTQAELQVGYRIRDEVALFVLHARDLQRSFITREGDFLWIRWTSPLR